MVLVPFSLSPSRPTTFLKLAIEDLAGESLGGHADYMANLKDFQRRARSAQGIEDWEKGNPHFVVSGIRCIQATENV